MTVNGHTVRENVENAVVYNDDVIRTLDNPVMTEPGLGVLYGNLAPEGSIIKIAAVPKQLMHYRGKAKVFNSLHDGLEALRAGRIHEGDACVLRFMGLKGRFGTTRLYFPGGAERKAHAVQFLRHYHRRPLLRRHQRSERRLRQP